MKPDQKYMPDFARHDKDDDFDNDIEFNTESYNETENDDINLVPFNTQLPYNVLATGWIPVFIFDNSKNPSNISATMSATIPNSPMGVSSPFGPQFTMPNLSNLGGNNLGAQNLNYPYSPMGATTPYYPAPNVPGSTYGYNPWSTTPPMDMMSGTPSGFGGAAPGSMTGGTPTGFGGTTSGSMTGGTPTGFGGTAPGAGMMSGTPTGFGGTTPGSMTGGTPTGFSGTTPGAGMMSGTPTGFGGTTPGSMTGGTPTGFGGTTGAGMMGGTPTEFGGTFGGTFSGTSIMGNTTSGFGTPTGTGMMGGTPTGFGGASGKGKGTVSATLDEDLVPYNINAADYTNPRLENDITEIIKNFDLDLDEDIDLTRINPDKRIDDIFSSITQKHEEIISLLRAYNMPFPIIKLLIRKIIKLTLYHGKREEE